MNKGENPTIMRFNRNAFVQSSTNTTDTNPASTNPNSIRLSPTVPDIVPVVPVVAKPTTPQAFVASAPTAPFNAADRLAQLRAEAMKSVNKTVVSGLGLKKQVTSDVIKVNPISVTKPNPTSKSLVSSKTAASFSSVIPKAILTDLPDDLFTDDTDSSAGLSLTNSPSPRRRQDSPTAEPASRILAKQAARLSALRKQKTSVFATPISSVPISTKPFHPTKTVIPKTSADTNFVTAFPAANALISNPVDRKSDLATLARKISSDASAPVQDYKSVIKNDRVKKRAHKMTRKQKIIGALITSTVALGVSAWVIYLSAPDLAIKIAASSAGLDVAYPSTIVQGFVISDVSSSATGEITINYTNKAQFYTITQKKSSWDSDALLNNFVIPDWGDTYSVIREKGLTIYVASGRAAWVSGGVQNIIDATSAGFTNDQLRSIALSM